METLKLAPHSGTHPLMKCGHAANGTSEDGSPVCIICVMGGSNDPAKQIADPVDLTGRTARCAFYGGGAVGDHNCGPCRGRKCDCEKPSSTDLAFFGHNPKSQYDNFYCGCRGWD